ncbi:MAG TPA: hypothetical protein DIU39_03725 [Flavobacteriales bacterium]|nr:hypothetical protein [Flavobacteriales bacterium]|tara:strand:+ start:135481 stop:135933 length:453 start_codon:yes stop_codon:yes gene_type:complete
MKSEEFYKNILQVHSYLRWILLITLIWLIIDALKGYFTNKTFENKNDKLNLVVFIAAHLQFLVGLILYFISPSVKLWLMSISKVMKNPEQRFYVVEHGLAMVIAIALITIGRIVMKKAPSDKAKFARLAVYNTLALLIILWMIPWSRGLF